MADIKPPTRFYLPVEVRKILEREGYDYADILDAMDIVADAGLTARLRDDDLFTRAEVEAVRVELRCAATEVTS